MRHPLGSLRLILTACALAVWQLGAASAHAWQNTSTLNGNQAVNVSVGCHADVAYPTQHKDKPDHATKPRFTHVFENPIAEFLSLHFKHLDLPEDDYIVLRPTDKSEHKPSVTYYGKDTRGAFFSRALYTTSLTLELYSNGTKEHTDDDSDRNCYGFAVDKYRFLADAASFESSQQEQVCDADDSQEAACFRGYPEAFKRSNAVARLLIHKDGASYFCTGWLVGCEGHVMTNHHCISNSLHAANTEFEFQGQGKSCADKCNAAFACGGKTRATTARLVVANADLDYALVKVEGKLHKEYGYLQMREGGASVNEPIYMPQHPAGWGKRIAMKDGGDMAKVTALDLGGCLPNQVGYYIDTQGGSSGSPVLSSRDHAVVALHHCGGCPNTGVNVDKIVKDLRDKELLPKCAVFEPPDAPFDRHDHR